MGMGYTEWGKRDHQEDKTLITINQDAMTERTFWVTRQDQGCASTDKKRDKATQADDGLPTGKR